MCRGTLYVPFVCVCCANLVFSVDEQPFKPVNLAVLASDTVGSTAVDALAGDALRQLIVVN